MSTEIVVIDAGPTLNFLCSGQIELLHAVLDRIGADLAMPAEVRGEVAGRERRRDGAKFAGASKKLDAQVRGSKITVLPSNITDEELMRQVQRVAGEPYEQRVTSSKDLGEVMVIAQVLALRREGRRVIPLIDEWRGMELATRYGAPALTTIDILKLAARAGLITNRGEMRTVYEKLARYDNGMVAFETTPLNAKSLYRQPAP